jgi:hypothetical protein
MLATIPVGAILFGWCTLMAAARSARERAALRRRVTSGDH